MNQPLHLFEFMDLEWLPASLRRTLRESLECAFSRLFRGYYAWVAEQVLAEATGGSYTTLVELGAGPAPITRRLANDPRTAALRLVPCDINPDQPVYEELAKRYPEKVVPRYDPVDLAQPHSWGPGALLFLSASFHHVPPGSRAAVLRRLTDSAERVMVFEPLRHTFGSLLFALGSFVPALVTPLWLLRRPGRLGRFFWCWLLPVAPLLISWDGVVSWLRMWREADWKDALQNIGAAGRTLQISRNGCCLSVVW
jgi:hypothetical protein